jgi:hypothetical protein
MGCPDCWVHHLDSDEKLHLGTGLRPLALIQGANLLRAYQKTRKEYNIFNKLVPIRLTGWARCEKCFTLLSQRKPQRSQRFFIIDRDSDIKTYKVLLPFSRNQ